MHLVEGDRMDSEGLPSQADPEALIIHGRAWSPQRVEVLTARHDFRYPRAATHTGQGRQAPPCQYDHVRAARGGQCLAHSIGQLPHPGLVYRPVHGLVRR